MIPEMENKQENSIKEDNINTSLSQNNVDANLAHQKQEKIEPEATVSEADPNWKAFREARKKDRAEKEAAEKALREKEKEAAALKAAMEAAFSKTSPVIPPSNNAYNAYGEPEESEDQRIERRFNELYSQREGQKRREEEERERQLYPNKLAQAYPDFNAVVTSDNLDFLEYHHPEIARSLKRQTDGFDKWSDAYHLVKKFVPNAKSAKFDDARATANAMKPKSMSSMGSTQNMEGASSARLSDDRKAANWRRMQESMNKID